MALFRIPRPGRRRRAHSLYPRPRIVCSRRGSPASSSILRRSRVTCTSTLRSPAARLCHRRGAAPTLPRHDLARIHASARRMSRSRVGDAHRFDLRAQSPLFEIEAESAETHARGGGGRRGRRGRRGAGCWRCAATVRAARTAWQIIVDAGLEPGDAVGGLAARRQHQDRGGAHAAPPRCRNAREFDAALAGHHHIEHDEVEGHVGQARARFGGVGGGADPIALLRRDSATAASVCAGRRRRREDAAPGSAAVCGAGGAHAASSSVSCRRRAARRQMRLATFSGRAGRSWRAENRIGRRRAPSGGSSPKHAAEASRLQRGELQGETRALGRREQEALAAVGRRPRAPRRSRRRAVA